MTKLAKAWAFPLTALRRDGLSNAAGIAPSVDETISTEFTGLLFSVVSLVAHVGG
jgi:hypothetical protein